MAMLLGIFVTVVGVALIAWGIRGRRFADDARRCRRCGYDLRATTSERCPECGASLAGRRATRAGRVWRRPRWIVVGIAVAVVGGATLALDRGGWLNVMRVRAAAPASVHLWLAGHGPPRVRGDAIDLLLSRYRYPSVYPERVRLSAAQAVEFADVLIDARADASIRWQDGWNAPIDHAVLSHSLKADRVRTYLEGCLDECLDARLFDGLWRDGLDVPYLYLKVRPGRVTPFGDGQRGDAIDRLRGVSWAASPTAIDFSIDGVRIAARKPYRAFSVTLPSRLSVPPMPASRWTFVVRDFAVPADASVRFGVGRHRLDIDVTYDVRNAWSPQDEPVVRTTRHYELSIDLTQAAPTTAATLPFRDGVR